MNYIYTLGDRVKATEWSIAEQGQTGTVVAVRQDGHIIGIQFDRAKGNVKHCGHSCDGSGAEGLCLWDLANTYHKTA